MTATYELRKMLDERGVKYSGHYFNTSWIVNGELYVATENTDKTLTLSFLTPEQAIAVTLGNEREQRLESVLRDWITCDPRCTNRSCGDCEHDEDEGCGLYRRMCELGVISR